jgi:hypothetical protein
VADLAELADRLEALAEELADAALDRLRVVAEARRAGEEPDPALVGEERRITRARRAVEKAAGLLGGSVGPDEGP